MRLNKYFLRHWGNYKSDMYKSKALLEAEINETIGYVIFDSKQDTLEFLNKVRDLVGLKMIDGKGLALNETKST